jgi:uncharacterized membrane protein HdeD (DUF308 family)
MAHLNKLDTSTIAPIQRHWGWVLGLGILLFVLGIIGLSMEIMLTIVSMYFFAALLIISGLSHFVDAFKYKQVKGALGQILIAFLYVCAGLIVLYDPLLASAVLTALLAWLLIIIGVTRIIMAFHLKNSAGWRWILLAGITSFILGLLILIQWPMSGLWVIGMFIAIDLIVSGWTYMFMALSLRSV